MLVKSPDLSGKYLLTDANFDIPLSNIGALPSSG
jgi:hypothetical protein